MSQEAQVALGALWPAIVVAAAVMLSAWRPWSRRETAAFPHCGSALAFGLGFIASFLAIVRGWPGLPPKERWQWLLPIAIAATLVGFIASLWRPGSWHKLVIALALAVATGALLHPPPSQPALPWQLGLGALVFALALTLEPLSERWPGPSMPLALCIIFAGASQVIVQARFALLGLNAAAAPAALGVIFVIALFNPRVSLAHGAMYICAALLPAMIMLGWFYNSGDVPRGSFIALAAGPFLLWIAEIKSIQRLRPWQSALIRVSLAALPTAIAVGLAMSASDAEPM